MMEESNTPMEIEESDDNILQTNFFTTLKALYRQTNSHMKSTARKILQREMKTLVDKMKSGDCPDMHVIDLPPKTTASEYSYIYQYIQTNLRVQGFAVNSHNDGFGGMKIRLSGWTTLDKLDLEDMQEKDLPSYTAVVR